MAIQQTTVVNLVAAVRVQLRDSEMLPRIEEELKDGFGMIERLDNKFYNNPRILKDLQNFFSKLPAEPCQSLSSLICHVLNHLQNQFEPLTSEQKNMPAVVDGYFDKTVTGGYFRAMQEGLITLNAMHVEEMDRADRNGDIPIPHPTMDTMKHLHPILTRMMRDDSLLNFHLPIASSICDLIEVIAADNDEVTEYLTRNDGFNVDTIGSIIALHQDIGVLSVALEIVGHCLPKNRKPILKRVFSSKHFSVKERNACVKVAIEAKSWAKSCVHIILILSKRPKSAYIAFTIKKVRYTVEGKIVLDLSMADEKIPDVIIFDKQGIHWPGPKDEALWGAVKKIKDAKIQLENAPFEDDGKSTWLANVEVGSEEEATIIYFRLVMAAKRRVHVTVILENGPSVANVKELIRSIKPPHENDQAVTRKSSKVHEDLAVFDISSRQELAKVIELGNQNVELRIQETNAGTAGKNASNSDTLTNGAVGNLDALPTPGPPKRPRGRPAKKQGETKSPKRIAGRINPSRAVKVLCNATPSTKKPRTPTQDKPGGDRESTHAAAMGTILDEAATPRSNTQKWPPPISESQHQDNIFGQAANISRSRRDQQTYGNKRTNVAVEPTPEEDEDLNFDLLPGIPASLPPSEERPKARKKSNRALEEVAPAMNQTQQSKVAVENAPVIKQSSTGKNNKSTKPKLAMAILPNEAKSPQSGRISKKSPQSGRISKPSSSQTRAKVQVPDPFVTELHLTTAEIAKVLPGSMGSDKASSQQETVASAMPKGVLATETTESVAKMRGGTPLKIVAGRGGEFRGVPETNGFDIQASAAVTSSCSKTRIMKDNADEEGRHSQRISKRKADDLEGNTVVAEQVESAEAAPKKHKPSPAKTVAPIEQHEPDYSLHSKRSTGSILKSLDQGKNQVDRISSKQVGFKVPRVSQDDESVLESNMPRTVVIPKTVPEKMLAKKNADRVSNVKASRVGNKQVSQYGTKRSAHTAKRQNGTKKQQKREVGSTTPMRTTPSDNQLMVIKSGFDSLTKMMMLDFTTRVNQVDEEISIAEQKIISYGEELMAVSFTRSDKIEACVNKWGTAIRGGFQNLTAAMAKFGKESDGQWDTINKSIAAGMEDLEDI